MPQSKALESETAVMRRIEAAYGAAEDLPEKARERVMRWAQDVYHSEAKPGENGAQPQ